jgi:hypothetical protein
MHSSGQCRSGRAGAETKQQGTSSYVMDQVLGCICGMQWHIINHRDYIDGPFDTFEAALEHAYGLGKETRVQPHVRRRAENFYIYKPPYDRREHWQAEYWICTKEAATRAGVSEDIFLQPLLETWQ